MLAQDIKLDSTIYKAIHDEIYRVLDESADSIAKPFFVSYTVADMEYQFVKAQLGSTTVKIDQPSKTGTYRLMIGDYHINDENYIGKRQYRNEIEVPRIPMPVDNDYWGIRRSAWSGLTNSIRRATESYKNKINFMDEEGIDKENYLDDYEQLGPVVMDFNDNRELPRIEEVEAKAKRISKMFIDFPEFYLSAVDIMNIYGRVYVENTEGSRFSFPVGISTMMLSVGLMDSNNDYKSESISYNRPAFKDLPNQDVLSNHIKILANYIAEYDTALVIEEKYEGPVMLEGANVADLFISKLFKSGDLLSSREVLNESGYEDDDFEEKVIGDKITAKNINVVDCSRMLTYKNHPLIGGYYIDGEGVYPEDSLLLIKEGEIVSKLNSRIPNEEVKSSNGHYKTGLPVNGYVPSQLAPGVVFITTSEPVEMQHLKTSIIELCKKEELDYYIAKKSLIPYDCVSPDMYIKVNIESGKETLLKKTTNLKIPDDGLEEIVAISGVEYIYNTSYGYGGIENTMPLSVICPKAIVLEEAELTRQTRYAKKNADRPVVPSPLELYNNKAEKDQ
ncbi:MAG: hypothetical protein C0594_09340 [Marinilabiliales bacterium]|nr:MAG: hypothetical protein C0594_09340 [Marinilabiliales bacterium]